MIFINNLEGVVHHINVDFKQLIDFKCSYNRKAGSGVLFLNKFELGMSYVNLTFNDEFAEDPYPGLWKGQKNISIYGLLLSINILEYKPRKEIHTAFMFGVKSRFTLLENPQTMVFENSTMGQSKNGTLWQGNGNNQFWFYPEVYLRVNYNF